MKPWIFPGIAIVGEVVATSALKASDGFTKPVASLIVAAGYIAAFYFLSLALRSIPSRIEDPILDDAIAFPSGA